MKRVRQGMTSSQVMTVNNMTNPAFFVFCFSKCQGTIKCSVFHKFCYFVRYFNHLWVPEQKSVEGLRRRTDYWHCDHEWERKCWFCLIANNTSAHSWTRGPEASVSSLQSGHLLNFCKSRWRIKTISFKFCQNVGLLWVGELSLMKNTQNSHDAMRSSVRKMATCCSCS